MGRCCRYMYWGDHAQSRLGKRGPANSHVFVVATGVDEVGALAEQAPVLRLYLITNTV